MSYRVVDPNSIKKSIGISNLDFASQNAIRKYENKKANLLLWEGKDKRLITRKWTRHPARTIPTYGEGGWTCVCWAAELGMFVACGYIGVMYSYDGITWLLADAPMSVSTTYFAICWSPELNRFVAFSDGINLLDKAIYSDDGITWDWAPTQPGGSNAWKSVCWSPELGMFCAVADADGSPGGAGVNKIGYSYDGLDWTLGTFTNGATSAWYNICWSPELMMFVALSYLGTYQTAYSYNGIDWTVGDAWDTNTWFSVCWSTEKRIFLAVSAAQYPGYEGFGDLHKTMYSVNGINWNYIPNGVLEPVAPKSICWVAELGIFLLSTVTEAEALTPSIAYSYDGFNWIFAPFQTTNKWTSICWSPELGKFVAVAFDSSGFRTVSSLSLKDI